MGVQITFQMNCIIKSSSIKPLSLWKFNQQLHFFAAAEAFICEKSNFLWCKHMIKNTIGSNVKVIAWKVIMNLCKLHPLNGNFTDTILTHAPIFECFFTYLVNWVPKHNQNSKNTTRFCNTSCFRQWWKLHCV